MNCEAPDDYCKRLTKRNAKDDREIASLSSVDLSWSVRKSGSALAKSIFRNKSPRKGGRTGPRESAGHLGRSGLRAVGGNRPILTAETPLFAFSR